MNRIFYILLLMLFIGCGGGSGNGDTSKFLYMWNLNPNSSYHQDGRAIQNSDINITDAWNQTYGGGVKVAIIDECFDETHEDLSQNIIATYNVNNQSTNVSGDNCHGTKVAGVIGANQNTVGLVGVAPDAELILISINLDNSSESDFINAFEYAKNQGAKVINCSWGSNHMSEVLSNKLQSIKNSNIITVFASGNEDLNLDNQNINDESESPYVIGVGATGAEDNDVTEYSSYGSNIDILAPGGTQNLGLWLLGDDNSYIQNAGTSFSSPTVAGVVALMLSKNPNLSFENIYEALTKSADKVGSTNSHYDQNGFDTYRAYGKINASNAINY